MSADKDKVNSILKVAVFIIMAFLVLVTFYTAAWRPSVEADFLALILVSYTLLLVLPFSKFKLGVSGFEGELEQLASDRSISAVETDLVEEVNTELGSFARNIADPSLTLMKISIEIETTLRDIAELYGLRNTRTSMGMLVDMLRSREVLTDTWMLNALDFFRRHRNEVIHEGRTKDLGEAIDIGKTVLAKLRQIYRDKADRTKK